MTLRRLTGVDAAFLAAERPGQPLHMMGLLLLDVSTVPGGYRFDDFVDFLARRLPLLPPLRRRLVEVPGGLGLPLWVEETEIDLDLHVRRAAVPSPGGPRELSVMASEMLERPLDRSRPLWEMALVEGVEGDRVALLAKLHHAMMDGLAGIALMASLFGTTPEIPDPPEAPRKIAERVPTPVELLVRSLPWLLDQPGRATRAGLRTAWGALRRGRSRRGDAEAPALEVPRSWLNVETTSRRAVAYQRLPLEAMRAVGRPLGASLNDVLLAAVAGALHRYLDDHGVLSERALVAGVPLAVREQGDERANAFSSVSVGLATDLEDPAARLVAIRDAMAARKGERGSSLGEDIAAWAEVPPPRVFSLIADLYLNLHLAERIDPVCNLVISSVPGPPESLYLAGARLEGIYPLGPIYSGLALNVTAIGCGNSMDIGLVACRGRMPDLWDLADAIPPALDELAEAVSKRCA
jgi:WS/DGAT/MGAT family acyltransferase